ncbi:MAG: hypothetical protein IJ420_06395 [Lachnospiraceae bacterium]|nr:hypothetical protein [Lachnospiraceae bacterium]
MKKKYLKICPYNETQLEFLVKQCIRNVAIVLVAAVGLVIIWNGLFEFGSPIYLFASVSLTVYLVFREVINYQLQEKENLIYQKLLIFFPRVKHHYLACRHMANAIVSAAEDMGPEMEQLALELYRLLMEVNQKEKIRCYIEQRDTNRYWKLFLIQAYEVSEKGDNYFAENVEHIRMELMEEIYRRKYREYSYNGYVFVTIAPFFMMPVFKYWGLEFAAELSLFYSGAGRLLEVLIFFATLVIYNLISDAKEIAILSGKNREAVWKADFLFQMKFTKAIVSEFEGFKGRISKKMKKLLLQSGAQLSYGRLCFRMFVYAAASFLVMAVFFSSAHTNERKDILSHVENMNEIAPVVSEEKRQILEKYILEITSECSRRDYVDENTVKTLLQKRIRLGNEFTETAVVEEIMKRLHQYERAKGTIWEFMLCVLGGIILGCLPLLQLFFRVTVIRKESEYEVKQFQSLVLMERRIHEMTVVGLLEDMEAFSICFKQVLQRCINSYGFDSREALLRLKQEGMLIHAGFEALADAFLSVDEVGIELAFAEVENDRRLLERMSRLEAEATHEKKRDRMELLTQIPMILAVGAYFILPFFLYSLQGVSEVFEMLEEMHI